MEVLRDRPMQEEPVIIVHPSPSTRVQLQDRKAHNRGVLRNSLAARCIYQ